MFFQVPELRDLHQEFYTALKARLEPAEGQPPPVGDLFLRMVGSHHATMLSLTRHWPVALSLSLTAWLVQRAVRELLSQSELCQL